MSTNSIIGIKRLDGSINKIYCHWDGYIEHNGLYLQLCYDTPKKIEELLKLGNLSSLGETIENCNAYHRDRKEKWEDGTNYGRQEFNYLFDENLGAWSVTTNKYLKIGSDYVNTNYEYDSPTTVFLIDELMKKQENILEYWDDDEFSTKENLMKTLLDKATAQVKIANERKAEEYDSWYRAYCD